jgi:hypothetical protein
MLAHKGILAAEAEVVKRRKKEAMSIETLGAPNESKMRRRALSEKSQLKVEDLARMIT